MNALELRTIRPRCSLLLPSNGGRFVREKLVPVLEGAGLDLLLSGHSHSYERSVLMRQHYGDNTTWNGDKSTVWRQTAEG